MSIECEEITQSVPPSKHNNLITHVIGSYGGINSLMLSMTNTMKYIPKLCDNKWLSALGKTITVSMVAYDFIIKIKSYYDEKSSRVDDQKSDYIHMILGNDTLEYRYRYDANELKIPPENLAWLLTPHNDNINTSGIIIKSYYDINTCKKYNLIPNIKEFGILVEYHGINLLLEIDQLSILNNTLYTFKRLWTLDADCVNIFVDTLSAKYMESVGVDKNVITYDGISIDSRPRSNIVDFDITSINFDRICNDIKLTLDRGGRRGILFTGNPGTGKTSVLLKLEHILTEYPILYVNASNLNDEHNINRLSLFMRNIGNCIVFIEDMDSMEIDRKTKKIAPILSLLDNSRSMASVVFVATINDSSLITPSIVRTGRFDEVVEIKEPSRNKDIYNIIKYTLLKLNNTYDTMMYNDISFITYMRMKFHKLTQSDYCEIAHKINLSGNKFNNKSVVIAMKQLINSKKMFKKYKDVGSD